MKFGYMLIEGHDAIAAVAHDFPKVQFVRIDDTPTLRANAHDLEGLIVFGFRYGDEVVSILRNEAPSLKWIQWANAGIDTLLRHGYPRNVAITYAPTVWGSTVAEHAVALLLGIARQFPRLERDRVRSQWQRHELSKTLASIEGRIVILMGLGPIGRGIAQRLRGFGTRVIAVASTSRDDPDVETVLSLDRLDEVLPSADALVIAIPSSSATRGIIDRRRLGTMKRSAILVNVARGDIVDEIAMAEALAEGSLAGAGLDAFSREPLPANHPFWGLSNVILSPHVAGNGGPAYERLAALLRDNLGRYLSGEQLLYPAPL